MQKTNFKIDSSIPLPPAGGRGQRTAYPFEQMNIGDSFFVPEMTVKRMSGQVSYWKKPPHDMHFAIRAVTEDYVNEDGEVVPTEGVRVWKIEKTDKPRRGRKPAAAAAETAEAAPAPAEEAPAEAAAPAKGKSKVKAPKVEEETEY